MGGTAMTGPHIVRELAAAGHDITIFHRGKTAAPGLEGVREILGDPGTLRAEQFDYEAEDRLLAGRAG